MEGELYATGQNDLKQLGIEGIEMASQLVKVEEMEDVKISQVFAYNLSFAITEDNELYLWGTLKQNDQTLQIKSPELVEGHKALSASIN